MPSRAGAPPSGVAIGGTRWRGSGTSAESSRGRPARPGPVRSHTQRSMSDRLAPMRARRPVSNRSTGRPNSVSHCCARRTDTPRYAAISFHDENASGCSVGIGFRGGGSGLGMAIRGETPREMIQAGVSDGQAKTQSIPAHRLTPPLECVRFRSAFRLISLAGPGASLYHPARSLRPAPGRSKTSACGNQRGDEQRAFASGAESAPLVFTGEGCRATRLSSHMYRTGDSMRRRCDVSSPASVKKEPQ